MSASSTLRSWEIGWLKTFGRSGNPVLVNCTAQGFQPADFPATQVPTTSLGGRGSYGQTLGPGVSPETRSEAAWEMIVDPANITMADLLSAYWAMEKSDSRAEICCSAW